MCPCDGLVQILKKNRAIVIDTSMENCIPYLLARRSSQGKKRSFMLQGETERDDVLVSLTCFRIFLKRIKGFPPVCRATRGCVLVRRAKTEQPLVTGH